MSCSPQTSSARTTTAKLARAVTSKFELLTPNQKKRIVDCERARRRLLRYIQVRQQSYQCAQKIRENVTAKKERELSLLKKEIAEALVRRKQLESVLSPISSGNSEGDLFPHTTPSRRRKKELTAEDLRLISKRNKEALLRVKKERLAQRAKMARAVELRKKAVKEANLRSRGSSR